MATIENKFGLMPQGIHFKEPWKLFPYFETVTQIGIYDSAGARQTSDTVAFFTQLAARGFQDTTNWTADTYKTLLTVSSGKGFLANLIGPTTGAAETTTFRITVDGTTHTIAVAVDATTKRAMLLSMYASGSQYTTANTNNKGEAEALAADKSTFNNLSNIGDQDIPPWRMLSNTPMLTFNTSLLVEAKHSANITNSTATAYSGGMYLLGL